MSSTSSAESYRMAMQASIRRSIGNAVEWNLEKLRQPGAPSSATDPEMLVGLLEKVLDWDVPIGIVSLSTFTQAILERLMTAGPGPESRRREEYVRVTDEAISRIHAGGGPVSELLLSQASYYAFIADRGPGRVARIDRAVELSVSPDERCRSVLFRAKFSIDVGNYREAAELLSSCEQVTRSEVVSRGVVLDLLTVRGILAFYGDMAASEAYLRSVLKTAGDGELTEYEARSTGAALHYTGRILAARGRPEQALQAIVDSHRLREQYSGVDRKGSAFNHIRIAEILLDLGDLAAAEYHLRQCAELLRSVQETSNGEVQMNLVIARLDVARGQPQRAEHVLAATLEQIRDDPNPRVESRCQVELLKLYVKSARFPKAGYALLRLVKVTALVDILGMRGVTGSAQAARRRISPWVRRVGKTWRRGDAGDRATGFVRCPCGEHGAAQVGLAEAGCVDAAGGPSRRGAGVTAVGT